MKAELRTVESYRAEAGDFVQTDGSNGYRVLILGDDFTALRLETATLGPIKSVAVVVEVTGRLRRAPGGGLGHRCKVTFPGDGEPDVTVGGWVMPRIVS